MPNELGISAPWLADIAAFVVAIWPLTGAFFGAIVGAVITGFYQRGLAARQLQNSRYLALEATKREVYFDLLGEAFLIRDDLNVVNASIAGRVEPTRTTPPAVRTEMQRRDEAAAAAIASAGSHVDGFELLVAKAQAIGDPAVTQAAIEARNVVISWFEDAASSSIHSGKRFADFRADYQRTLESLTSAVRQNLGIDALSAISATARPSANPPARE